MGYDKVDFCSVVFIVREIEGCQKLRTRNERNIEAKKTRLKKV